MDSLIAVDIRAWFLKELGVDVPTPKILGGGSIVDFVKAALEKLTGLIGGASCKDDEESHAPQAHAPGMPVGGCTTAKDEDVAGIWLG